VGRRLAVHHKMTEALRTTLSSSCRGGGGFMSTSTMLETDYIVSAVLP
jgi:hypothetical protein